LFTSFALAGSLELVNPQPQLASPTLKVSLDASVFAGSCIFIAHTELHETSSMQLL
jgi:hypothetical protein